MALHTFDVIAFRVQYPQFADPIKFPDYVLQLYWDAATDYIDPNDNPETLSGTTLQRALNLMTAHLAAISVLVGLGQNPGFIDGATIDRITVSIMDPAIPPANEWQWWLCTTPYGTQLLALLKVNSVGGLYVGGLPETYGFRKVGGIFAG